MQLAAEMRKRTPQLRCLFALPSPNVSIRAAFEIGPAVRWGWRAPRTQQTPRTGRAGCWDRLRWEREAGLPVLLPLPPPALRPQMRRGVEEGCSGENKTRGQHSLCQAVPGACWSWMSTAALHSRLISQGCFRFMGGSFPHG